MKLWMFFYFQKERLKSDSKTANKQMFDLDLCKRFSEPPMHCWHQNWRKSMVLWRSCIQSIPNCTLSSMHLTKAQVFPITPIYGIVSGQLYTLERTSLIIDSAKLQESQAEHHNFQTVSQWPNQSQTTTQSKLIVHLSTQIKHLPT